MNSLLMNEWLKLFGISMMFLEDGYVLSFYKERGIPSFNRKDVGLVDAASLEECILNAIDIQVKYTKQRYLDDGLYFNFMAYVVRFNENESIAFLSKKVADTMRGYDTEGVEVMVKLYDIDVKELMTTGCISLLF